MINNAQALKDSKKGFTLLELLIVIAILAILATVVVLVLNPAEYLKQARDTQRTNDMNTLSNALNLVLTNATSTVFTTNYTYCTATTSAGQANTEFSAGGTFPACTGTNVQTGTAINGTGWVPVDFTKLSGGSPLAKLPIDPQGFAYFFAASSANQTYRLAAKLESSKYASLLTSDGGANPNFFEVGTDLTSTAAPF